MYIYFICPSPPEGPPSPRSTLIIECDVETLGDWKYKNLYLTLLWFAGGTLADHIRRGVAVAGTQPGVVLQSFWPHKPQSLREQI